jgi:hypothetical protein
MNWPPEWPTRDSLPRVRLAISAIVHRLTAATVWGMIRIWAERAGGWHERRGSGGVDIGGGGSVQRGGDGVYDGPVDPAAARADFKADATGPAGGQRGPGPALP